MNQINIEINIYLISTCDTIVIVKKKQLNSSNSAFIKRIIVVGIIFQF